MMSMQAPLPAHNGAPTAAQSQAASSNAFYHQQEASTGQGSRSRGSHSSRSSTSSLQGLSVATDMSIKEEPQEPVLSSWVSSSPSTMRGRIMIPQTPNSLRQLPNDTPGLSSSASNTPAGGTYEMPWTPVQPTFTRPIPSNAMQGGPNGGHLSDGKGGLQLLHLTSPPNGPLGAQPHLHHHHHHNNNNSSHMQLDGGVGMSRIASAPLPYNNPGLFETPATMTIELPMSATTSFTPDTYMWQSQDSYFSAPHTGMTRSMTEIQPSMPSISPMAIMERTLSSSSSMPSLNSACEGDVMANTPSNIGKAAAKRRQRRSKDPPEVSSEQHKPHQCAVCKHRFIRLEHLKRHWKTHSQERPYPCPIPGCDKRFGRTDNRDQHIKTHTKSDPHKRSFAQLMALTKGEDGGRNDPHNAARSSAFAAIEAASRHKRINGLEGPIALTQPGSSPSRGGLFAGGPARFRMDNDENRPAMTPLSPMKIFERVGSNSAPSSPPLQIRNQIDLDSKLGPGPTVGPLEGVPLQNVDPFASSYQHHFGDNSSVAGAQLTAPGSHGASSVAGQNFMGQPLLYTISENELQFVASGAVAPYPLTPSITATSTACEPPFLYSPSALGLTNAGPVPGQGLSSSAPSSQNSATSGSCASSTFSTSMSSPPLSSSQGLPESVPQHSQAQQQQQQHQYQHHCSHPSQAPTFGAAPAMSFAA